MINFIPLLNSVTTDNIQLLQNCIFLYENDLADDITHELQKIPHEKYKRLTLKEIQLKNVQQLNQQLRAVRNKFEIIVVEAESAKFVQHAINDRRVDGIKLTKYNSLKIFNPRLFSRMKRMQKFLEIDIGPLLFHESSKQYRLLFRILHSLRDGVPILLSYKIDNNLQIREYRNIRTLGAFIGINKQWTKEEHILAIINRNKRKLAELYFANGIQREVLTNES